MILKAREVKELNNTVNALLPLQLKMPFAYEIAVVAREIHDADAKINVMKQEIIERYAKRNSQGELIIDNETGTIQVEENKISQVNKELDNLYTRDIEINLNKIKIENLKDLELTVGQIATLIPLIEK